MPFLLSLSRRIDGFTEFIGRWVAWLVLAAVLGWGRLFMPGQQAQGVVARVDQRQRQQLAPRPAHGDGIDVGCFVVLHGVP